MGNGRNHKIQQVKQPPKQKLIAVLFVILFAGIGSYFVFQSKAASSASFALATGDATRSGNVVSLPIYLLNIPAGGPYHAWVQIETDAGGGQSNIPSITQCTISSCSIIDSTGTDTLARGCAVLNRATSKEMLGVVKYQLKPNQVKYQLNVIVENIYKSSDCSRRSYSDIVHYGERNFFVVNDGGIPSRRAGSTGNYCIGGDAVDSGGCVGASLGSDTNSKNTKTGTKITDTGARSGGGPGGSTAKTQNDKPNTVPSSSEQGSTKQPELNPSPFYDGKQYAPGSDAIDKTFGNISVVGRKIVHSWVYLLGVVTIAGGAGVYYWLKRKR